MAVLTLLRQTYEFHITEEPDEPFLRYLRRRLGVDAHLAALTQAPPSPSARRLDISLEDEEGDVVAGLAAVTDAGWLKIELLWVEAGWRGQGWGARLLALAEEIAVQRGCGCAQIGVPHDMAFFHGQGYRVRSRLAVFPTGQPLTWLEKCLDACVGLPIPHHAG